MTSPGGPRADTATPSGSLTTRLLRLHYLQLRGWQRLLLFDGALVVGVLLALAELATPWAMLVLPLAVAGVVKLHDITAGLLGAPRTVSSN